jgi:hypothetical protein
LCASCHRLLHERYLRGDQQTDHMLTSSASDRD